MQKPRCRWIIKRRAMSTRPARRARVESRSSSGHRRDLSGSQGCHCCRCRSEYVYSCGGHDSEALGRKRFGLLPRASHGLALVLEPYGDCLEIPTKKRKNADIGL